MNYQDNAYRVIRAANLRATTSIDGFTISGSNWNTSDPLIGGGIFCQNAPLQIAHCVFIRNRSYYGGGIGIVSGTMHVASCLFQQNWAQFGGAINSSGLSPTGSPHLTIEDCELMQNTAGLEDGGAVVAGTNTTIRRCTLSANSGDDGGAIAGSPTAEDSIFANNHGDYGGAISGGGMYTRCTFKGNTLARQGERIQR